VAIDAGHGGDDVGGVGPTGLVEADAAYLLAEALSRQLQLAGANPILLRSRDWHPEISERAAAANESGAEVLIAIHLNSHTDPRAEGASSYFYGREGWSSPGGRRLAELIQEHLCSSLGLKDGRAHPKALPLLRETQMPAVHVEPCFITNPQEEAKLRDPAFRASVAAALARATERFFGRGAEGPGDAPHPEAGFSARSNRS
jgi:N-acetylmuramoyl-L-alanine amidase